MDRFTYQIFQFSTDNGLIESDDSILISISGGIDSMSLFCLLDSFREKIDIKLSLIHFNHGLRKESEQEEVFLRQLAAEKNVPIHVVKADHLDTTKGMQNQARHWRYEHLKRIKEETKSTKIALGHHLNDLIETQIWRMLRGGSLFSFSPMSEISLPYIRPLLYTEKEKLKLYLQSIHQNWCEDDSNQSNKYTRNKIRNQLIPLMKECAGEKLEEKFLALHYDSKQLKTHFDDIVPVTVYESKFLNYKTITELTPIFANELINRFLIHNGQEEITRINIQRIYDLVKTNQGNWSINLKNNQVAVGKYKKVKIV